jgi:hypothetical protein
MEQISFFIILSVNYVNIMVWSLLNPLELAQIIFPAKGFSIRILLFGEMELDQPQ